MTDKEIEALAKKEYPLICGAEEVRDILDERKIYIKGFKAGFKAGVRKMIDREVDKALKEEGGNNED